MLHKKRFLVGSMAVFSTAALLFGVVNGALNDGGIFELDGNAVTNTTHDWDQVYADSLLNGPTPNSSASAISFKNEPTNSNTDTIFTGGGSKDTLGIQQGQWLWKTGKPQPKDDIADAFAAAY